MEKILPYNHFPIQLEKKKKKKKKKEIKKERKKKKHFMLFQLLKDTKISFVST
jgi:hypothetical protein